MNSRSAAPRATLILALLSSLLACEKAPATAPSVQGTAGEATTRWFSKVEPQVLRQRRGLYFIEGLKGYQQTTEYTCGPAALLALSRFYEMKGITADAATELRIAQEAGTRSLDVIKAGGKPGTTPDEMARWLGANGFDAKVEYEDKGDGSGLARLKENAMKGIPTLVEWADLGGHWVIVVGYDTRGNEDPWDDVLILADSYDRYDDYRDGYSYANANRFYWLWYDAFCFNTLTWRTALTATPREEKREDATP